MTKLVTGEMTVQFAVWVDAEDDVKAEETAVRKIRTLVDNPAVKVVGRPRNVEVKDE